jgi:hypothetical protein
MLHLSCRLAMVILLVSASLAMGAPVILNATPAQSPSAGSDALGGTPGGSSDGYQKTVLAFQQRVDKAHELIELLQKINRESKVREPDNVLRQQTYFLMKLNEVCPGSTYDGSKGKAVFQKNFTASFNNTMNVDSITELGEVSATYLVQQNQILISFGTNSVMAIIDSANPSRSRFTKAVIPGIAVDAESILTIPGYKRVTTDSVETSILNDAYQLLSQTNTLRMDYFAADIMRSPKLQKKALGIAASGYFERHSVEYQKGIDSAAASSRKGEGGSRISFGNVSKFMGSLLMIIVLGVGFFWAARRTIVRIQMFFMDDSARKFLKSYRALSPMVLRSLGRLGRSLWGSNFLWSRKYYLTKRSDRWVLSDSKVDRYDLHSHPDNLIEVCLRDDTFKIRVARIRGITVNIAITSSGHSRQELMGHLRELSTNFSLGETELREASVAAAGLGATHH